MKALLTALATAALLVACGTATQAPTDTAKAGTPTQAVDGTLIGPDGRTLYVFSEDKAGKSVCNATCAVNWPPLAVAAGAAPLGDYTIVTRDDGARQWAFKGKPLYHYAADKKAGDKQGNGMGGMWSVAKP